LFLFRQDVDIEKISDLNDEIRNLFFSTFYTPANGQADYQAASGENDHVVDKQPY
jgi:hypothetical protein